MNIDEILGHASTLSHILLILKNHRDIDLPNVLYHDLQSTVQNLYFMTAKFKVYFPGKDIYVYQMGSDQLEQLFSSVRTQSHDRNCDVFQLKSRLERATILEKVLNKNPSWRQNANRLSGPVDHTSLIHWTGNRKCGDLILNVPWQ